MAIILFRVKFGVTPYLLMAFYTMTYEIVRSLEEADGEVSVEKAIVKKNSICDETICIGYDVELKKAVFIDPEDMRVIYPEW